MKVVRYQAFTLIELLITIAIISILVATAIPSYRRYTIRAHYTELVTATAPFKLGIEECFQTTGTLQDCSPGLNGVPDAIKHGEGVGLVDSIMVKDLGKIVATPKVEFGIKAGDTYILAPIEMRGQLTWKVSGGGVKKGYAR